MFMTTFGAAICANTSLPALDLETSLEERVCFMIARSISGQEWHLPKALQYAESTQSHPPHTKQLDNARRVSKYPCHPAQV
jgi:hypothetical protein